MQDVDSEAWFHHIDIDLFLDDEDLADKPFVPLDDEAADSSGQNLQALIAETAGSDVPRSGLLGSEEPSHIQYEKCLETLVEIFPGISLEYVRELYNTCIQASQSIPDTSRVRRAFEEMALQIVDANPYPKEKDRINELKRKRSQAVDSDKEDMLQRKSSRKEQKNAGYFHAA